MRPTLMALAALFLPGLFASSSLADAGHRTAPPSVETRAIPPTAQAPSDDVPTLFETLGQLATTNLPTASVRSLTIERDAGTLHVAEGTMARLDFDGRTVGVVFDGRASFQIAARHPSDGLQLARLYGSESVELAVEGAVLLFSDQTAARELAALDWSENAETPSEMGQSLREALRFLMDEDERTFDAALTTALLNAEGPFFHAHLDVDGDRPHFYRFDARDMEEVSFGREHPESSSELYQTVASFNRADQPVEVEATEADRTAVSIMQVQVEAEFDDGADLTGASTAFLTTNVRGGSWVPFHLYSKLELDALQWGDGTAAEYSRGEGSAQVWVKIPDEASEGSFLQLTARYRGEVGEWRNPWYFLGTTTGWYLSAPGTSAAFDVTFRSPVGFPVMAAGERTEHEVVDGVERSRWILSRPFGYTSFNAGRFTVSDYEPGYVQPVRVQVNESAHRGLSLAVQQRNAEDYVANDIARSLGFFQNNMGRLDQAEFNITEIPYLHGQAFPGMIHLSFMTFGLSRDQKANEVFRAHEVAHQWWGVTVRPHSYRDAWLAEGMSEFSALWFLEAIRGNDEETRELLGDYRDRIRDREDASPTALGPRVSVDGRDDDYQVMVYEKGAWIGQMLRHLLTDYDAQDEAAFRLFLKEVMTRYKGQSISTREFQGVLEEVVGADMGWFFDQWVFGNGVPEYRVATEVAPGDSPGQVDLRVRVRQEGVSESFRMFVPLRISLPDGTTRTTRMLVSGPETIQEFVLPAEPDQIELDPFDAVLATVRTERW